MSETLTGIDVSSYQHTIDWSAVVTANLDFIACKATQFGVDPQFRSNWSGMRAHCASSTLGAYHFLTGEPAAVQADRFFAAVGPLRSNETIALDCEASPGAGIPEFPVDFVLGVLHEIELRFGRIPITYMGRYYRDAGDARYRRHPLWLPAYSDNPKTVRDYIVHQFTDAAHVPGIAGNVDGDHVVDLPALRANAQGSTPLPSPPQPPKEPATDVSVRTLKNPNGSSESFAFNPATGNIDHQWIVFDPAQGKWVESAWVPLGDHGGFRALGEVALEGGAAYVTAEGSYGGMYVLFRPHESDWTPWAKIVDWLNFSEPHGPAPA